MSKDEVRIRLSCVNSASGRMASYWDWLPSELQGLIQEYAWLLVKIEDYRKQWLYWDRRWDKHDTKYRQFVSNHNLPFAASDPKEQKAFKQRLQQYIRFKQDYIAAGKHYLETKKRLKNFSFSKVTS